MQHDMDIYKFDILSAKGLLKELCGIWEHMHICTRQKTNYVPVASFCFVVQLVVPKVLRDNVVRLAHEGHHGVVMTKYRFRSKVWWPGMDKDVYNLCKVCHGCQVTSSCDPPDPKSRVLPPSAPWQECSANLLVRPLPTGESILVVVDYYNRFLEVAILKSTTSIKIIEAITPMFARFGVLFSLRTR